MSEGGSDQLLEQSTSKPTPEANKKLVDPVAETLPNPPVKTVARPAMPQKPSTIEGMIEAQDRAYNNPFAKEARRLENVEHESTRIARQLPQTEPPLSPNMTRLYRAHDAPWSPTLEDLNPGQPLPQGHEEATGRWFSDKKEELQWFASAGRERYLGFVDIPTAEVEKYRLSNFPKGHHALDDSFTREREFFVSPELAAQMQPMPGNGPGTLDYLIKNHQAQAAPMPPAATEAAPAPHLPVTEPILEK